LCLKVLPKTIGYGGRKPSVDHNHETHCVRGILCQRCNLGLYFIENENYRARAIEYLNKPGIKMARFPDGDAKRKTPLKRFRRISSLWFKRSLSVGPQIDPR
jgi:recombination endonuclease VII